VSASETEMLVTDVTMPERGTFLVRCALPSPPDSGTPVLVTLDYGLDTGVAGRTVPFDPTVHGSRIPGYQLMRVRTRDDAATCAENDRLAKSMGATFLRLAQPKIPDLRLCYVRLSFARTRLFVRYRTAQPHADVSAATKELERLFGVNVNAWQLSPRYEVSLLGGLGPCGRACCCATWQMHYPAHLTQERVRELALGGSVAAQNGTCGRFKCCLTFEANDNFR